MPTRSLMRPREEGERGGGTTHGFSSRHFLKLIEDSGEVGFWSADLRQDQFSASIGLYRIFGLDPATEMTFGFSLGMIHPDDRAAHGDQFAVLRGGQPIAREFRIIRPDRTQRWILHRAEVIVGPDGRPSQGMGVVFDVTARHDSLRSVEQRHDRYNALLSVTAAVVWIASPDGEPLEMLHWQSLTGQSHAEVRGHGWIQAVHPDDRERTEAAWRTAITHASTFNTDYRILCADGVYRWFNARGVPIMNRDGSVREWIGVCLNVPGQNRYAPAAGRTEAPAEPADAADRAVTAAQVRAARGMTGLSKDELARRANVSVSTIVRLEDDETTVRPRTDTVLAVRRVLEQAGVEFTFDRGALPGVRPAMAR